MTRNAHPPDDSLESDAVWKLLDQAPPVEAGPRFAADTVRAARLTGAPRAAWWQRFISPIPLATMAAAMAALALAVLSIHPSTSLTSAPIAANNDEAFASIQELAEAEVLSAVVDNLDRFTDTELVCLIGL
jgi:hypothetical protein